MSFSLFLPVLSVREWLGGRGTSLYPGGRREVLNDIRLGSNRRLVRHFMFFDDRDLWFLVL